MSKLSNKPRFSVAITAPAYQNMIRNTLSDPNRANRFIASITSAVAINPQLQECEASTILAGALLGESIGLSPSPQLGQFYLIPFEVKVKGPDGKVIYKTDSNGKRIKNDKGYDVPVTVKNAQFVMGYKGYIQLALRSGYYADLDVLEIKQGEYLGKDKNTGKPCFQFVEDDDIRDTLPVVGYMAYFEYLNGFKKTVYWSRQKMMNHADKYSPAFSAAVYKKIQNGEIADKDMWKYSSFWYKDFDGMAKKTMLRQLISKWGVMSIELQSALTKDQNFIDMNDKKDGFLELPEKQELITSGDDSEEVNNNGVKEEVDLNTLVDDE